MAEGSRRCRRVALGMPVGGMVHARTTHGAGARFYLVPAGPMCRVGWVCGGTCVEMR